MADGTVKIAIEADGNKAIKSVKDLENAFGQLGKGGQTNGLTNDLDGVSKHSGIAKLSIVQLASSMGLVKVASAAFGVLKNSIGSAVDRFDTLNKYPVVMKALGYSTKDVTKSVKTLNNGIDGLPTSLDEISASAQQLAPLTGGADSAAKSAVALNDAFLSSSASVSDASRGMQQYTQMLSTGKVDLMSWRTLQETMPIALRKTANAFGYTGKSAENDLFKALQGGKITIDQLNDKFIELDKGQNGFADLARKNSVGIKTSFANLKTAVVKGLADTLKAIDSGLSTAGLPGMAAMFNSLKPVIANFFKEFNSAIAGIVPKIVSFVSVISSLIGGLAHIISAAFSNDMFKGLVVGILSAFAAFKMFATVTAIATSVAAKVTALISVIKNVGAGISILFNAIKSGKEIVAAFNLVLGVNPFVLLGIAIAAVVAGLVYFFAKTQSGQKIWANFTNFLSNAWSSLKDIASNVWTAIVDTFTGAVDGVKNGWSSITSFFSNLWNGIVASSTAVWSGFTQALSNMWQGTVMVAQTIWGGISTFFTGLWNSIISIATSVWNIFGTSLTTIWQGIVTVAQGVWEMLKAVIMGPILILIDLLTGNWNQLGADLQLIWTSIVTAASTIWNGLVTYFTGILSFIGTYFSTIWNGISAAAIAIWNGIVSAGQAIWNGFVSTLSAIWSGLVNAAISFWNALKNGTISIFNGLVNGSVALWNGLVSGVKSLVISLVSGVVSLWNGLRSSVISIANGIKNGAINAWNGLVSGVRNIVSTVVSIFNGLRNIDLLAAGRAVINGFIKGLTGAWEAGKKFISGIGDWIREHKGPISYDKRLLIPAGNAIMSGLNKGLVDNFGTVKDSIADITEGIANSAVITMPAIEDSAFNKSLKRINNTLNGNRLSAGLSFAGITAESASGVGRGLALNNSVVNNYSNTATTTVQSAKESNDKVLEALNVLANNRPVAIVDGSSFAPAYEQYGSTETARRSQMKGRGLAVDSKF